jgi:ankyrin repeat protein
MVAAARNGYLPVVQLLLDLRADPLDSPDSPWSDLEHDCCLVAAAAAGGNPQMVQLLLDRGATLHLEWDEALGGAAINGRVETARLLLTTVRAVADVQQQVQQPPPQQQHTQQEQPRHQKLNRKQQPHTAQQKPALPAWANIGDCLSLASEQGHIGMVLLLLHSAWRSHSRH